MTRHRSTDPLVRAVLAALTYSDHFGFPLTYDELYRRLPSLPLNSPEPLYRILKHLVAGGRVVETGGYYHLPRRSGFVSNRLRRRKLSGPVFARAKHVSSRLGRLPGIAAIFLTGSLAMLNTDGTDDIDLMIITNPGLLWSTRLIVTAYTSILGLRRTPSSRSNSGKLCLNLYLSAGSLRLPVPRRSLYTAYELTQAVPLFDPYQLHPQLLSANRWLEKYLPNTAFPHLARGLSFSAFRFSPGLLLRTIEKFVFRLQYGYMKNKITRELITSDMAFFHPRDPGRDILRKLDF